MSIAHAGVGEVSIEELMSRQNRIEIALDAAVTEYERDSVKKEIVTLFRDAEAVEQRVRGVKESVRSLALRWKHGRERNASSKSTRIDHLGASTFVEKGWSKLSVGDAAGAEIAFRRALELTPSENEAETLLAWAMIMQNQSELALLTLNNVLLRDPKYALARANVGYIYFRKRMYTASIEHLTRAIRLGSDSRATLYAHLYIGMVYRAREMYEEADRCFVRALELGPNLLQGWYELGCSRWSAGNRAEACVAWQSGADANKFNPWGKRCADTLKEVEQGRSPVA